MSNRKKVEKIFYKALESVKADKVIKNSISLKEGYIRIWDKKVKLDSFNDLYIFSVGKAGLDMARAAEEILGKRIKGGVAVSSKEGELEYISHFTSTHPIISDKSLFCADKIIEEIKGIKEDDLFIFLLSGGASALIEKPIAGIILKDFQKISAALLGCGIDIKALNKVRKSISAIKGGRLGDMFRSKGYVLVLSDVIGDDLGTIGSAPMYNKKIPHFIIGNNKLALKEAKKYIENSVKKTKILTTTLSMSSKKASKYISSTIKRYNEEFDSYCLLIGGETTTKVKGNGLGGRNQELALRLVMQKCIKKDMAILCAGSDGIDGNSEADGAFIDIGIYKEIKEKGLDPKIYFKNSDSYTFFKTLGYDFTTGITGTNVMDFVIVLKTGKNR